MFTLVETPELLLREDIFEDFIENSIQLRIIDLMGYLENWEGVWWNAYSLEYGREVKPFPFDARNGFFVDTQKRVATHRFQSGGITRRDMIPQEEEYMKIVPPEYRSSWFDTRDARRSYAVLITEIKKIIPIQIEEFGLFQSWGKVSSNDRIQRPRLIQPNFQYTIK